MSKDDMVANYRPPKDRLREAVPPPNAYSPPDGMARSAEEERRINEAFAAIFREGEAGQLVLSYLRSVTLNLVSGPGNLDNLSLAHREGQRYLMALIDRRVILGRNKEPRDA